MRELTLNEIDDVAGAVDQATAIGTNLGIVAIGVGVSLAAGMTAPVWFPVLMIVASVAVTASYVMDK